MINEQQNSANPILNKWMLNCKEATEVMVINEFEAIPTKTKFALWLHLKLCKLCRIWNNQSILISKLLKESFQNEKKEMKMNEQRKQIIEEQLKQQN